jgi:multidrug resistance efflux pump
MADRRRFWQLFFRQLAVLVTVTLGLVAILYFGNMMPYHSPLEWTEYIAFDVVVILAASALVARVRLAQEERRRR